VISAGVIDITVLNRPDGAVPEASDDNVGRTLANQMRP
jgi:hypothetical protein